MAVHAAHTTQAGLVGYRWGDRRGGEVDDTFAVGPRTGDTLRGRFTDQQTVAGTTHVLFARRGVPYWLKQTRWFSRDWVRIFQTTYETENSFLSRRSN